MKNLEYIFFGLVCAFLEITLLNFPTIRVPITLIIGLVLVMNNYFEESFIYFAFSAIFLDVFSNMFGFHIIFFLLIWRFFVSGLFENNMIKGNLIGLLAYALIFSLFLIIPQLLISELNYFEVLIWSLIWGVITLIVARMINPSGRNEYI